MKSYYSKYVAVAKITDPTDVENKCLSNGWTYDKGAIFCYIPELGYEGTDYIYCRYGLSIPYIRVKENAKVLVEPTIGESGRWFYTGLVDCGQDDAITPATTDVLHIDLTEGTALIDLAGGEFKIVVDDYELHLDKANEIFTLKLDTLELELDKANDTVTINCDDKVIINATGEITIDGDPISINGTNLEILA